MEATYTVMMICIFGTMLVAGLIFVAASIRIVQEDTRLSVYRLGRYTGDKGPGLVLLMPFVDRGVAKQVGSLGKTIRRELLDGIGEACTTVYSDGKVSLAGEEWDAVSHSPISAGQRVRVIRMFLEVEKE